VGAVELVFEVDRILVASFPPDGQPAQGDSTPGRGESTVPGTGFREKVQPALVIHARQAGGG
jgi:hypothetical protein